MLNHGKISDECWIVKKIKETCKHYFEIGKPEKYIIL